METPAQMCARLLTALEDLAAQESATLQARDFTAAIAIQDRAAPLVELLAAHREEMNDPMLRARVAELSARRSRTGEWLAEQMARVREELRHSDVARRRVAQVAPVYGRGAVLPRQLSAVG
jgi:hypothetical protein